VIYSVFTTTSALPSFILLLPMSFPKVISETYLLPYILTHSSRSASSIPPFSHCHLVHSILHPSLLPLSPCPQHPPSLPSSLCHLVHSILHPSLPPSVTLSTASSIPPFLPLSPCPQHPPSLPSSLCHLVLFLSYLDKYNDLRSSLGRSTDPHTACLRFLCKQLLHLLYGVVCRTFVKKELSDCLKFLTFTHMRN
jgi:hypothetical protein